MSAPEIPIGLPGPLLNVFGGSFIGNFLTALCFGAITVQVARYFDIFRRDALSTRSIVVFLWIVEAFQLVCVTQSMWHYFIVNFGNPLIMLNATWQFSIYQIGSVTSSATVQTFFAYRVYSLSNSVWFGCLVETFAIIQCGFGIAISIKANKLLEFAVFVKEDTWLTLTWLACQAAADIVICLAMVYLLRKRRTGFKNTDSVLNLMIVWTINTGVITALLSIVILIAFARAGFHFVVLTIGLPLGGFYTFTMMANLHSRTKIAERWTTQHSVSNNSKLAAQSWPMTKLSKSSRPQNGTDTLASTYQDDSYTRDRAQSRSGPYAPDAVIIDVIKEREILDEDGTTYPSYDEHKYSYPASSVVDKKHHIGQNISFQLQ